jgi:hypothetical protein
MENIVCPVRIVSITMDKEEEGQENWERESFHFG